MAARVQPEPTGDHGTSMRVVPYDNLNPEHRKSFIQLLNTQKLAHGYDLSPGYSSAANSIGREINVSMIYGRGKNPSIVGMTTTSNADSAQGPICVLEDIVVLEEARQQGNGGRLMNSLLLDAWERNKQGVALETGRLNQEAAHLYLKIDPTFNVSNLQAAWSVSAETTARLARKPYARLATDRHLDDVILAHGNKGEFNYGFLASKLVEQGRDAALQNIFMLKHAKASAFILGANGGSIAIASEGYSTFDARIRADVRLNLSETCGPKHVEELVRGAAFQISHRERWQGAPMHIEFSNNTLGVNAHMTRATLQRLGCEVLEHNGVEMVPYSLHGERYVRAVINAIESFPDRPLSRPAQKRLSDAKTKYNIED